MTIDSFSGKHAFLSNFHPCRIEIHNDQVNETFVFQSVEAAYQACKSKDPEVIREFQDLAPAKAKRKGRKIEIQEDWDDIRINVMTSLLMKKFTPVSLFTHKLLETGDAKLIEGNNWGDTFWGICEGKGQNALGIILMEIRDLRREQQ